jgi:hypothetical protein
MFGRVQDISALGKLDGGQALRRRMAANPPGLRVLVVLVLSRWCFVMLRSEEGLREPRQAYRSPSRVLQAFYKAASCLGSIYCKAHLVCLFSNAFPTWRGC